MSLTVRELMKLPCLKRARVVAGRGGLDRIVTSVSVLEYSDPNDFQQKLYESIEFWGSELVITGFSNVAADIDAQCENIRRLAAVGEVGVILYYVGLILPRIDPLLIKTADELDFVLISMPENDPNQRYSEVIQEVMFAIFNDQMNDPAFALDLLEQMSKLTREQQTVKTILRITSDRLRASAVICDADSRMLSAALWPLDRSTPLEEWIGQAVRHIGPEKIWEIRDPNPVIVYREELNVSQSNTMLLFVFSENGKIDPLLWKEVVEGVRLGLSLWGKKHDRIDRSELVRAIILDEPIKMRRLGELYRIDVEALSDMWILKRTDGQSLSPYLEEIRAVSAGYISAGLCESYGKDVLIFPAGPLSLREQETLDRELTSCFGALSIPGIITRCPALQRTADVKRAYEMNMKYLADAAAIFPSRTVFSISEIEFARECRETANAGLEVIRSRLTMLDNLLKRKDGHEIVATLASFLLDHHSSITETAKALFVHKNTVKYRLQKAEDVFGYRIGDFPQSEKLMSTLALQRLLTDASANVSQK